MCVCLYICLYSNSNHRHEVETQLRQRRVPSGVNFPALVGANGTANHMRIRHHASTTPVGHLRFGYSNMPSSVSSSWPWAPFSADNPEKRIQLTRKLGSVVVRNAAVRVLLLERD